MAQKCAKCGGVDVQALADRYQCLDCGALSTYDGEVAEAGLAWTSEEVEAVTADRPQPGAVVLKNQADRKRGGDQMTTTQSVGTKEK